MPSSRVLPAHQQRQHNSQARCSTQKEGSTEFRQRPKVSVANYPSVPSSRVLNASQHSDNTLHKSSQAVCSTQRKAALNFVRDPRSRLQITHQCHHHVCCLHTNSDNTTHKLVAALRRKAALNFVRDPRSRLQITHQCHHHVCCLHTNSDNTTHKSSQAGCSTQRKAALRFVRDPRSR